VGEIRITGSDRELDGAPSRTRACHSRRKQVRISEGDPNDRHASGSITKSLYAAPIAEASTVAAEMRSASLRVG
jgi:hypothetical protein